MWRSFFLAIGTYCLILGAECLAIDKAELKVSSAPARGPFGGRLAPSTREVEPAEWAPWSLMSGGAVVILYSFTLPAKLKS
jgi:hypothetical protein